MSFSMRYQALPENSTLFRRSLENADWGEAVVFIPQSVYEPRHELDEEWYDEFRQEAKKH